MIDNMLFGIFVAFDGPNGVGKSTIINELQKKLIKEGYNVEITKEPSDSTLGLFLRKESESLSGDALACLVASNRYEHIEKEIKPLLQNNRIVLCDRYILSSLILQGMDGVDEEFIMNINNNIIKPDIQIALVASQYVIQNRLKERSNLTRFEKNDKSVLELKYLSSGIGTLRKNNIKVYQFNTEDEMRNNVNRIYDIIVSNLKEHLEGNC